MTHLLRDRVPIKGVCQIRATSACPFRNASVPAQLRSISPATGAVRVAETSCQSFATGLILNQMAYKAGKNTSVRTVPPKVPPIKVYASVPQKTDWVSGMNASMAASAARMTGRERCTVASTTAAIDCVILLVVNSM